MPYHSGNKKSNMTMKELMDKIDFSKYPKPLNKPRKTLNKLQKDFMKDHTQDQKHKKMMTKLMKMGYCIEQSHKITSDILGKHK